MVEVLGYDLSDYDVVEYEKEPELVVKKWNGGEYYTLAPEYDKNQMFYNSQELLDEEARYFSAERNRRLEQPHLFSKIILFNYCFPLNKCYTVNSERR